MSWQASLVAFHAVALASIFTLYVHILAKRLNVPTWKMLRAVALIVWECYRHPCCYSEIDIDTGKVDRKEAKC